MWEFDHTEGWVLKNWCFQIVVLQRTLESSLHSKELKLVYPKGSKQLIFIGRTDAEVETSIPWSLMWRADLLGKPWCWERLRAGGEGMTEDEMVGWNHWFNGHRLSNLWELVMDREAWLAAICGVAKSQTRLSVWSDLIGPYGLLILTQPREHFSRILRWKLGHVLWLSSSIFKNLFSRNTCLDILRLYVHLALFIIMIW